MLATAKAIAAKDSTVRTIIKMIDIKLSLSLFGLESYFQTI